LRAWTVAGALIATIATSCTVGAPLARACTVFTHSGGGEALAGNNEDCPYPFTVISFYPAQGGDNGYALVGYDQSSRQGGVNDKGLFFDWLALPPETSKLKHEPGKKTFSAALITTIMTDLATVDGVLKLLAHYDLPFHRSQLIIGDKTGASAIIEAGAVVKKKGAFQVGTNFRQSSTPPAKISCWRYKTAVAKLQQIGVPTVAAMRDVADAVHQEGGSKTQYTTIYDLKRGKIHLYHFHHYKAVKVFDLGQELAKGQHVLKIPDLFAPTAAWTAYRDAYVAQLKKALAALEPVTLKPATLERYAGVYQLDGGGFLVLQKEQDRLVMPVDPLYEAPLIPLSDNLFVTFIVGFSYQVLVNGKTLVIYARGDYGFGHKACSYYPAVAGDVDCAGWTPPGTAALGPGVTPDDPLQGPVTVAPDPGPDAPADQGGCSVGTGTNSKASWLVLLLLVGACLRRLSAGQEGMQR
jgi:hypothetical protein